MAEGGQAQQLREEKGSWREAMERWQRQQEGAV